LRVPLLWVVGAREMAERSVTQRGQRDERRAVPLGDALDRVRAACAGPVSSRDGGDAGSRVALRETDD
jgi:uncharacterized protein YciI